MISSAPIACQLQEDKDLGSITHTCCATSPGIVGLTNSDNKAFGELPTFASKCFNSFPLVLPCQMRFELPTQSIVLLQDVLVSIDSSFIRLLNQSNILHS